MKEYFEDMCLHGFAFGIFEAGELVSVTDAPDMPYMSNQIQEIGINTLEGYRHKGYATSVASACIQSIIGNKRCPIWSCSYSNKESEALAYKVGFKKLADVLKISL